MADRAKHFTTVTRRNAIRVEAHLPRLDIRHEIDLLTWRDRKAEYAALKDNYHEEFERIRDAERQRLFPGKDLKSLNAISRMGLGSVVERAFDRFLATEGHHVPKHPNRSTARA